MNDRYCDAHAADGEVDNVPNHVGPDEGEDLHEVSVKALKNKKLWELCTKIRDCLCYGEKRW